ncbi:MAG TPA: hypothetical protein VMT35_07665 [Ignavibacteriaceae bacterium]|nr:hypothetical protein [Ignavibacteriaceae bacterium]
MKDTFRIDFYSGIKIIFVFLLFVNFSYAQGKENGMNKNWENLKYAIYFTANDINNLLSDSAFQETMDYFAPIKAEKVYLEGNSREDIDIQKLRKLSDKFKEMGMEVSGAMVPVSPKGGTSCFNNAEDLASLEKRMRSLAQVFDTIILDDWLFTTCVDEKSVKDRGNLSWADYRTKLILEQSKKYIINPAKKVNPKVKVIIKYPNWYEGHRENGYDVYNETNLFDQMAVGIETRGRMFHDQHIPVYSGYIFQKWFSSVDPGKWVGSWLDNYEMKGLENDYVAQAWQAVLAQAPEIILWCAGQLYSTGPSSDVYPHLIDMLPDFDKAAGMLKGNSRGVPIYLPYGSSGEYNIFGYLGMAGVPLDPVGKFPDKSQNAIFTLHSLQDSKLADKMIERLRNGLDIFMTWGLWQKLQNTEFKNTLNLLNTGREGEPVISDEFRVREQWWRQEIVKADKKFTFQKIETTTWPYVRNIAVRKDDYDYGVLLNVPYLKGTMYVLNVPDDSYDLLRLPPEALNLLRRAFVKELNVELDGPGGVGMYLFGEKQYVLYNMSDDSAPVSLRFIQKVETEGWKELMNSKELSVNQDTSFVKYGGPTIATVSLELQPFEIAIIQAP